MKKYQVILIERISRKEVVAISDLFDTFLEAYNYENEYAESHYSEIIKSDYLINIKVVWLNE